MALSDYQLSYQVSPIILVGGIAGAGLPIVSLLNSQSYPQGILSSATPQQIADYFGQFRPLPGHTLMDLEVATYPLANQVTAANAVITNPLRISLEMIVPATGVITLANKLTILTNLKGKLDDHTAQGGWYNVATPSFVYTGCLLTTLVDASDEEEGAQVQVRWIWNFMQPLLTEAAAQAAQNQAMAKLSNQTQNTGDPPGSQPITTGIGQPSSGIAPLVVPAATNPAGSNVTLGGMPTGTPSVQSVSPIAPGS